MAPYRMLNPGNATTSLLPESPYDTTAQQGPNTASNEAITAQNEPIRNEEGGITEESMRITGVKSLLENWNIIESKLGMKIGEWTARLLDDREFIHQYDDDVGFYSSVLRSIRQAYINSIAASSSGEQSEEIRISRMVEEMDQFGQKEYYRQKARDISKAEQEGAESIDSSRGGIAGADQNVPASHDEDVVDEAPKPASPPPQIFDDAPEPTSATTPSPRQNTVTTEPVDTISVNMDRHGRPPGADEFDVQRFDNLTSPTSDHNSPEHLTMEPRKLYNTTGTPAKDGIQQFSAPKRVQRELSARRLILPPLASGVETFFPFQTPPMAQNSGYGAPGGSHMGGFSGSQSVAQRGFALEGHLNTLKMGDEVERLSSQAAANYEAQARQHLFGAQSSQQSSSTFFNQFTSTNTDRSQGGGFQNYNTLEARSGNISRPTNDSEMSPRTRSGDIPQQQQGQAMNNENGLQTNSMLPGSYSATQRYATMQSLSKLANPTGDAMKQQLSKFSASEMQGRFAQSSEPAQQPYQGLGFDFSGLNISDNQRFDNNSLFTRRESSYGQGSQQSYSATGQPMRHPPGFPQPLTAGPPGQRPAPIGSGRLGSFTSAAGSTPNFGSTPNTTAQQSSFDHQSAYGQQSGSARCEDDPDSPWYRGVWAPPSTNFRSIPSGSPSDKIHETATMEEMKVYYPNGFPKDMYTNPVKQLTAYEKARMLMDDDVLYPNVPHILREDSNSIWHANHRKLEDRLGGSLPDLPRTMDLPGPIQRPTTEWLANRTTLTPAAVQQMGEKEIFNRFEEFVTKLFGDLDVESRQIALCNKLISMNGNEILKEFGLEAGDWLIKAKGRGLLEEFVETFYMKNCLTKKYVPAPKDAIDTSEDGNKSYFMDPRKLYTKEALAKDVKATEKEKAKPSHPLSQEWRASARAPAGTPRPMRPAGSASGSSTPLAAGRGMALGRNDSKSKRSDRR